MVQVRLDGPITNGYKQTGSRWQCVDPFEDVVVCPIVTLMADATPNGARVTVYGFDVNRQGIARRKFYAQANLSS